MCCCFFLKFFFLVLGKRDIYEEVPHHTTTTKSHVVFQGWVWFQACGRWRSLFEQRLGQKEKKSHANNPRMNVSDDQILKIVASFYDCRVVFLCHFHFGELIYITHHFVFLINTYYKTLHLFIFQTHHLCINKGDKPLSQNLLLCKFQISAAMSKLLTLIR